MGKECGGAGGQSLPECELPMPGTGLQTLAELVCAFSVHLRACLADIWTRRLGSQIAGHLNQRQTPHKKKK